MKQALSILLAAALSLSLAGCSHDAAAPVVETETVAWRETDVTPDANHVALLAADKDGRVHCITVEDGSGPQTPGIHYYIASAGGDFAEQDEAWQQTLTADLCAAPADAALSTSFALAEDGTLYLSAKAYSASGSGDDYQYTSYGTGYYLLQNGALQPLDLPFGETTDSLGNVTGPGDWTFMDVADDALVMVGGVSLAFAEPNAGTFTCADEGGFPAFSQDGVVYCRPSQYSGNDFSLLRADPATGKLESVMKTAPFTNACKDWHGGFYALTNTDETGCDLSHYTLGADTQTVLLAGENYRFGAPGTYIAGLTAAPDGTLYMAVQQNGSNKIYSYTVGDEPTEVVETLTLFGLRESAALRQAVSLWNAAHPETPVQYTVGESGENGQMTVDDIIRQVNTELLAGSGPAILDLDGLDAQTLMENDLLADISAALEGAAILPNITAPYTQDGAVYAVPLRICPYLLGGRPGNIESLTTADAVQQVLLAAAPLNPTLYNERVNAAGGVDKADFRDTAIYFNSADEVFDAFYPLWASSIWNGKQLNGDALNQFLAYTQAIVAHNELKTEYQQAEERQSEYTPSYSIGISNPTLGNFNSIQTQLFLGPVANESEMFFAFSNYRDRAGTTKGVVQALPGPDGQGRYVPGCTLGLTATASETAKDFIAFALGNEAQSGSYSGVSVNTEVIQAAEEKMAQQESITMDCDVIAVLSSLENVTLNATRDETVKEIALETYEGTLTSDAAAAEINSRLALWMQEQ